MKRAASAFVLALTLPPVVGLRVSRAGPPLTARAAPAGPADAAPVAGPASAVPAAAPETAEQSFERVYGARLRRARNANDHAGLAALAAQLLSDASELRSPLPLRTLLLEKAYDLGCLDCAGYETALKAAEQIARLHPSRRSEADEKALTVFELEYHCPKGNGKDAAGRYLEKVRQMAEERVRASATAGSGPDGLEALNAAVNLYQRGAFAARAIGPDPQAEVLDRIKALRQLQDLRARVELLRRQLDRPAGSSEGADNGPGSPGAGPDNRKAAAELVRLLAIQLNDPAGAAEYAPAADDPTLIDLVALAARDPASLREPEARRLADWYRQGARACAVGRAEALAKARVCYERVLALHAARDVGWLEAKAACGEIAAEQERDARQREARVETIKAGLSRDKVTAGGRTGGAPPAAPGPAGQGGGD